VNRYFTMVGIHLKFSNYLNREITSKVIWDHLDSMYDMPALHESEIIPFPNEEVDFELPEDFNDLVKEKFGVPLHVPTDENETPKNGSSVKTLKKPNVSKLKQSSTPVSSKNTFATPASVKSSKNHSDSRPPSSETVKVKQESPFPSKVNKVKRSSSPFTAGKSAKSETSSVKDEPTDAPVSKKTSKLESNNSLSAKKVPKSENNSNSSKKSIKQEPSTNSVRLGKPETPDITNKKIKSEKELSKKGRSSTPIENSVIKKSSKLDVKKVETDNKKPNDVSSSKPKTDKNSSISSKGSKTEENEPSGSRKSITKAAAVVDSSDKKRKRQKTEESSKKAAPPTKRRRT
ncbi:MRG/MORF4L-binding protein, partial [Araneus ventricosus]